MSLRTHLFFWSAISVLFLGFIYVFKAVLLPFVLAFAISYFLEPLMKRLTALGFNRCISALLILSVFIITVALILAALLPVAYRELLQLGGDLPQYSERFWAIIQPLQEHVKAFVGQSDIEQIRTLFVEHVGTAADVSKKFVGTVLAGGQAFLHVVSVVVITPIVAYFVMKEWNKITDWIYDLMPKDSKKTITDLLEQMDIKIAGFVRGQISVAIILGIAYAIALSLIGLKYGVLIGLVSGLLSIIPMLGSVLGFIVSVIVAWVQSSDWVFVLGVAGIFLGGQLIEGNFLTPKLVGNSVGMHPLWIFFALMAGGALFGVVGMLLAVPVAAVAGVLIAFGITRYKDSPYYKSSKKPKKKTVKKKKKKNA